MLPQRATLGERDEHVCEDAVHHAMTRPSLTVVMPVYNEEEGLRAVVSEVQREILDRIPGAQLLAVDDGSTDGSGEVLDAFAALDYRIRVFHQANRGHGGALLTGLEAARSEYVFLIDSDRQVPLEAFPPLWKAVFSGRRAAVGVRRIRRDAPTRIALTALIRWSVRLFFGMRVYDANVPFKLLRRDDWLSARPLIPEDTLAPSLFLGVFLKLRGVDVAEIEVPHRQRPTGRASVRGWRMVRFCTRAFIQLLQFRRRYRNRFKGQEAVR